MKLTLCASIRLGEASRAPLDARQAVQWTNCRAAQLAELVRAAAAEDAAWLLLPGEFLGSGYVPETALDPFLKAAASYSDLHIALFPDKAELCWIASRSDIPENLHLVTDTLQTGGLRIRRSPATIRLQAAGSDLTLLNKEGTWLLSGKKPTAVPTLTPPHFEHGTEPGFLLLTLRNSHRPEHRRIPLPLFRCRQLSVTVAPSDDPETILQKVRECAKAADSRTFVRLTATGKLAPAAVFPAAEILEILREKAFYAELIDKTGIALDSAALEHDITLRSSFARRILEDGSLSEHERSRMIRLGWAAFDGETGCDL